MPVPVFDPDTRFQLTVLGDITRHLLSLKRSYAQATRPAPTAIWDWTAFRAGEEGYKLTRAGWRNFPVVLCAVERGNALTASFKCYPFVTAEKTIEINRLLPDEMSDIAEDLRGRSRSPVIEHNLLMLNAAHALTQCVRNTRHGIPGHLIDTLIAGNADALDQGLKRHLAL